jgi:peptidoglycan/LPS O-acetylase OafA/YrhL
MDLSPSRMGPFFGGQALFMNKPPTENMDLSPSRIRFLFIDALRGLAALIVALHHIGRYGPLPQAARAILPQWIPLAIDRGQIVVQFFLVISGFVIAYSLRDMLVTPRAAGQFALRRLIRLGLPYWTIVLAVCALDMLAPRIGMPPPNDPAPTAAQIVAHVFFLHNVLGYGSISAGLWFVCIEVQFCLLFIALLGLAQQLPRGHNCATGRAGGFSLLAVFAPPALLSLFAFNVGVFQIGVDNEAWVSYFFGTFFLGIVACWALDGSVPRAAFWLYVLAVLVRLAIFPTRQTAMALGAALLIYLAGRLGRLDRWLSARWLQYLGRISYSLFLLHYPVSYVVTSVGYRFTGDSPGAAVGWLVLALLASIPAAHLFYVLVEEPAIRLTQRLKTPPAVPAA